MTNRQLLCHGLKFASVCFLLVSLILFAGLVSAKPDLKSLAVETQNGEVRQPTPFTPSPFSSAISRIANQKLRFGKSTPEDNPVWIKAENMDKIISLCVNSKIPCKTAMRIAECESQYGQYPINWNKSGAKGIYQFKQKTWDKYCEGDVMNSEDNIECFLKLYPRFPHWWDCK